MMQALQRRGRAGRVVARASSYWLDCDARPVPPYLGTFAAAILLVSGFECVQKKTGIRLAYRMPVTWKSDVREDLCQRPSLALAGYSAAGTAPAASVAAA